MSDWSKVTRPIPVPNEWTKPFWDAARRGVLELQRCQSCGHFQHPPYATCTQCVATDLKFEAVRGVGAIYATATKADAGAPLGPGRIPAILRASGLPIVAIGGITLENAAEAIRAGAAGVAVVTAVTLAEDMAAATRRLRDAVDAALAR